MLISKRIILKKIATMTQTHNHLVHKRTPNHLAKLANICNIPIETANICNIFPRPADSNELVVVELKQDLKYRGYV